MGLHDDLMRDALRRSGGKPRKHVPGRVGGYFATHDGRHVGPIKTEHDACDCHPWQCGFEQFGVDAFARELTADEIAAIKPPTELERAHMLLHESGLAFVSLSIHPGTDREAAEQAMRRAMIIRTYLENSCPGYRDFVLQQMRKHKN